MFLFSLFRKLFPRRPEVLGSEADSHLSEAGSQGLCGMPLPEALPLLCAAESNDGKPSEDFSESILTWLKNNPESTMQTWITALANEPCFGIDAAIPGSEVTAVTHLFTSAPAIVDSGSETPSTEILVYSDGLKVGNIDFTVEDAKKIKVLTGTVDGAFHISLRPRFSARKKKAESVQSAKCTNAKKPFNRKR